MTNTPKNVGQHTQQQQKNNTPLKNQQQVACRSVGKTAVFQMQDVLALDNEARMNTPGKAVGNWAWRMGDAGIWTTLKTSALRLYHMNKLYDRYGCWVGCKIHSMARWMHNNATPRLPKVEVPKPKAQQPERSLSTLQAPSSGSSKAEDATDATTPTTTSS